MSIDNGINFEKEIYKKNFNIGYEDGLIQVKARFEENGFRDGVEVK